jgi:hypothetical protein
MTSAGAVAEIEAVRDTVAGWLDAERSGWSATDRSHVLLALFELRERVDAVVLDATAEWDHHEAWSVDGSLTAASWLRSNGVAASDAGRTVRSARLVRRDDDIAKALQAGDITADHVRALADVVRPPRADLFDEHAGVLLDGARTLDVDDTAAMAQSLEAPRRWRCCAPPSIGSNRPTVSTSSAGRRSYPRPCSVCCATAGSAA